MKKIGIAVCLFIMAISVFSPACFATTAEDSQASETSNFHIVSSTPEDGADGVSVENLSVKIYFDTGMIPTESIRESNADQLTLTDNKGKEVPIKVYYSHKEEGLIMVVSDNVNNDLEIKGDSKYTLTIGKDLKSADGTTFGTTETITFKTLDQSRSTAVYMVMMGVMIVGMIFFTSRSAKKEAEKQKKASGKSETVNPYKEAKRTGKSVEEIVKKDKERKAKEAAALEKQRRADEELEESLNTEDEPVSHAKRVPGPRPISALGSTYRVKVKKSQNTEKRSTNPKNMTGKQKNSGKNKGGKKGKKK